MVRSRPLIIMLKNTWTAQMKQDTRVGGKRESGGRRGGNSKDQQNHINRLISVFFLNFQIISLREENQNGKEEGI